MKRDTRTRQKPKGKTLVEVFAEEEAKAKAENSTCKSGIYGAIVKRMNERAMTLVYVTSVWSKEPGRENRRILTYPVAVPTGAVEEMLEAAYMRTNRDDRPLSQSVCSTTAGDLVMVDGRYFLVERIGFREVTAEEYAKIRALTSRETSWGYDDMKRHGFI